MLTPHLVLASSVLEDFLVLAVYCFLHEFCFTDLGLRQPRLEGEEYLSIVDEFVEAVHARWPKAVVQVHFIFKGRFPLLHHYLSFYCTDISE